jgi:hypothetical protein
MWLLWSSRHTHRINSVGNKEPAPVTQSKVCFREVTFRINEGVIESEK